MPQRKQASSCFPKCGCTTGPLHPLLLCLNYSFVDTPTAYSLTPFRTWLIWYLSSGPPRLSQCKTTPFILFLPYFACFPKVLMTTCSPGRNWFHTFHYSETFPSFHQQILLPISTTISTYVGIRVPASDECRLYMCFCIILDYDKVLYNRNLVAIWYLEISRCLE